MTVADKTFGPLGNTDAVTEARRVMATHPSEVLSTPMWRKLVAGLVSRFDELDAADKRAVTWRPHTEKPDSIPVTALIVVRDETGELMLLDGIYTMPVHSDGQWRHESTDCPMGYTEYWWLEEGQIMRTVPAPMLRVPT